jgi:hypothetical protein
VKKKKKKKTKLRNLKLFSRWEYSSKVDLSLHEALGLIPSTARKQNNKTTLGSRSLRPVWKHSKTQSQKQNKTKNPETKTKHKALSSTPRTMKKVDITLLSNT